MTGINGTENIGGEEPTDEALHDTPLNDTSVQAERLALDGDDERLPWLEAGDDDQPTGADGSRILGAGILGLAVLAALVGAIWWFSHRGADTDLIADGSTVDAPATPYKQAPAAPGGKTFQGTGDTSFAVSAGQSRTGKIADPAVSATGAPGGSAMPSVTSSARPGVSGAAKAGAIAIATTSSAAASAAGGTGVQVGAFSSAAAAEAAWTRMAATHDALSGVRHRVVEGRADIGTVYRLQAVAGDDAAAAALCAKLRQGGVACQVKR